MLKKRNTEATDRQEWRCYLALLLRGPQKPWSKGPTSPELSRHATLTSKYFVFVIFSLRQVVLNQSERILVQDSWATRRRGWEMPIHEHAHVFLHLYIQTCIQNRLYTYILKHEGNRGCWAKLENINILHYTNNQQHSSNRPLRSVPLLWGPLLWTPLTLFQVPWSLGDPACLWSRYQKSNLTLKNDSHSAPFCLGGPNDVKGHNPCPLRTAWTAVVVVLKGSLYRNALFMIVIIIIVMII